jgi:outer membrane protein OmpA-like peptidoglycan-associated protein
MNTPSTPFALFITLLIFLFSSSTLYCQLAVDTSVTKEQLVEMLIDDIYYDNVAVHCDGQAIGVFSHPVDSSNLAIQSGILLTTGRASNAIGPNHSGGKSRNNNTDVFDKDLSKLANDDKEVRDRCILEFDIVPIGDEISFNYIFASEEYPEYVGSSYNDVFGFFVSGPGIRGPYENKAINIATLNNEKDSKKPYAVAINTINNGTTGYSGSTDNCKPPHGSLAFSHLYNDNTADDTTGLQIQYDGFTNKLRASLKVRRCQRYHFKLAIADINDAALDSGVFIEKNSFKSNVLLADKAITLPSCPESCDGNIKLEIIEGQEKDYEITWTVDGTAVNADDLTLGSLCAGTKVKISIKTKNGQCAQVINADMSRPDLNITSDISPATAGLCDGAIALLVSGGTAPYRYKWDNKQSGQQLERLCPGQYQATITDHNNCQAVKAFTVAESKITKKDKEPAKEAIKEEVKVTPEKAPEPPLTKMLGEKQLITFSKNSSELDKSSYEFLDKLAEILLSNKESGILLVGHASSEGPANYNMALSLQRAEQVKKYLTSKGAPASQIETSAKGEDQLLIEENTESARAQNRRVEIFTKK